MMSPEEWAEDEAQRALDARKHFEAQLQVEREFSSQIDAAFGVMNRQQSDAEFERLHRHHRDTPSITTEEITAAFTEIFDATGSSVFIARRREYGVGEDD